MLYVIKSVLDLDSIDQLFSKNFYSFIFLHVYEKFICTVQLFFINIGMFCLIKTPHINCDLAKELTEHQRQALLSVEILLIMNGNVFSEKQMNEQIIDFQLKKKKDYDEEKIIKLKKKKVKVMVSTENLPIKEISTTMIRFSSLVCRRKVFILTFGKPQLQLPFLPKKLRRSIREEKKSESRTMYDTASQLIEGFS